MRRADRLFPIIQILRRSTAAVTGAAIATELEVSTRTIYRDIADLVGQRVPITGEAGLRYLLVQSRGRASRIFSKSSTRSYRGACTASATPKWRRRCPRRAAWASSRPHARYAGEAIAGDRPVPIDDPQPFGVNLTFLPSVVPSHYPGYVRAIVDGGVGIVETAGNNPQQAVAALKAAGAKVIHKCTLIRHALKAQSIGCDAVSVDGSNAAGTRARTPSRT